jgi:hypothetical protein
VVLRAGNGRDTSFRDGSLWELSDLGDEGDNIGGQGSDGGVSDRGRCKGSLGVDRS